MRFHHLFLSLFLAANATAKLHCNGYRALCSRQYSNVSFIGAHDSAFAGLLITDNQYVDVTEQLDKGIRYLQAQVHEALGELQMCHTSCAELDTGLLVDYLSTVKTWMDANPHEVVSLLLVNGDGSPVSMFADAMNSSGLQAYAFTPPATPLSIDSWPTLRHMIRHGTRFVLFMDTGADPSAYPFILDEFSYYFETPYDVVDTSIFMQCNIDRPSGASYSGRMSIVNHFRDIEIGTTGIDIPDTADINQTNAAQGNNSIGEQAAACVQATGRWPNVVLVDYFNEGDVFAAQKTMNGLC